MPETISAKMTCPECRNDFHRADVSAEIVDETVWKYTTAFSGDVASVIDSRTVRRITFPCGHSALAVSQ